MLRERFNEALKAAMRERNPLTVGTIRMILAGVKDRDIAARSRGNTDGIDDGEILSLLRTMVKQRQDSIVLYREGGRPELADKEAAEIVLIEGFMPRQMADDEVAVAITAAIGATGAASVKDMGKVMAELRARHAGVLDFAKVGPLVRQALS
jgi:uncharacterized protein YqeY